MYSFLVSFPYYARFSTFLTLRSPFPKNLGHLWISLKLIEDAFCSSKRQKSTDKPYLLI